MESPVLEHYQVPLPGTPRRPGTLYCCSARRHKQQQETYPQPEGAGKRPSRSPEVNSNTWRLSWGAISKPTPAPPPLTLGNSRVVEGPAPLKELGSRAQAMCMEVSPTISSRDWVVEAPATTATQTTLHRPLMDLPAGGGEPTGRRAPTSPFRAEPGRVPWAKTRPPGARLHEPQTPGL
ncbi:hypothetical protein L3Q82_024513, partial [Scortum barcoo]